MENNNDKNILSKNHRETREFEKEILYISFIDKNSKIVVGMINEFLEIYSSDLNQKFITIKNQPSSFFTEISGKVSDDNKIKRIKLLCCSYTYIIKIFEIKIINDKLGFNLLYSFHPKESRNEISKAIELNNNNKNIVSIDENNIIIYEFIEDNYYEYQKIHVEGANDILNLSNGLFCVSLKNKGIIQFYETLNFELINEINHIETYGCNDYMCKLNEKFLFIGGFDYISIIDINFMQLNTKLELYKYKERITCTCSVIDENILIVGTKYKNIDDDFFYDIVIYELDEYNNLNIIKRFNKVHDKIINAIIYNSGNIISCSEDKKIKILKIK